jgi:branched-chain amino acid:cation transporter, LIVCS family
MGPFGVLARCLTVIHGALLLVIPSASLAVTSLFMCVVIYLFAANKNKIVPVLGTVLTPFLLVSIAAIVFFGLYYGDLSPASSVGALDAFSNGFFKGYQTMDLVASFFFSGFVIKHLSSISEDESFQLRLFLKSSFVGAGLLYLLYFALVLLGWLYAPVLVDIAPQEMFGRIALESLGSMAAPCVAAAVIFACLTTAITLTSLFADFLQNEVSDRRMGKTPALLVTLAIAFFVSNLEFSGIANFLGPILETIYPALITLTVINIVCKFLGMKASHWPFTLTVAAKLALV